MGRILHTTSQFSRQFFLPTRRIPFLPNEDYLVAQHGIHVRHTINFGMRHLTDRKELGPRFFTGSGWQVQQKDKVITSPVSFKAPHCNRRSQNLFFCGFLWYFLMVSRTPQIPKCCQFALRVSKQLTTIVILCLQFLRADQDAISLRLSSPQIRHALPTVMASKS